MAALIGEHESWYDWLRECAEDEGCQADITLDDLGMLTGQDRRALRAVDACWELYSSSDEDGRWAALAAAVVLLPGMQRKCWIFARELIARWLDWDDRIRLWPSIERAAEVKLECEGQACRDARALRMRAAGL